MEEKYDLQASAIGDGYSEEDEEGNAIESEDGEEVNEENDGF